MELVTGATGYVGGRLLGRLVSAGRPVRALARRPERVSGAPAVRGDLLSGAGLAEALEGCTTAYYLVHSMEAAGNGNGDFASRDRLAAENFVAAAQAAGLERIVYLGGIAPAAHLSPHLRSRLEVEEILLAGVPGSTALRASIVIGAGSSSFRVLVRLVERLRVLPLPAWRDNRTQPIAETDVIEFLARTPEVPAAAGRSFDVVGPDVVTYGELVERIAEAMGVGRMPLGLGISLTPPASAVVSAVTDQPLELVRPLMESLESDILPRHPTEAARIYSIKAHSFERAVTHALREWEAAEPLGAR
ncbi:MAG TPA: NAD(P)H-binding protein [Thermoleophilaceae bacterium]|nr:NAD(P)H-binding protein [Thermoleophilaceae bacterium]